VHRLELLHAHSNALAALPRATGALVSLRTLSLASNALEQADVVFSLSSLQARACSYARRGGARTPWEQRVWLGS
jgi:hypothetical protein